MLLDTTITYLPSAWARARFLAYLSEPGITDENLTAVLRSLLESDGLTLERFDVYTSSNRTFRWAVAGTANSRLIFVSGSLTATFVREIWDGYWQRRNWQNDSDPICPPLVDAAREMWQHRDMLLLGPPPFLYMCGYSAGGAILINGADEINRRWGQSGQINLATFGSPKAGGLSVVSKTRTWIHARFVNVDDPVPLVPDIFFGTSQRWWAGFSAWEAARMRNFYHRVGMLVIGLDGNVTPSQTYIPLQNALPEIQRWRMQAETGQQSAHSIGVYEGRLIRHRVPEPRVIERPPQTPVNTPPVPTALVNTPVSVERARQDVVQSVRTVFHDFSRSNQTPLVIPRQQLFTAKRQGRVWSVWFGDRQICYGPTKKRALGLKNAGNDFIRRLQRQGWVDVWTLGEQWINYLAAASDPLSGFSPQLAV